MKSGLTIRPFNSEFWRPKITVPSVPPTNFGGCKIINLDYAINVTSPSIFVLCLPFSTPLFVHYSQVEAHVSGVASNLKQSCPIIIGTVPVTSHQYETIPASAPPLDA